MGYFSLHCNDLALKEWDKTKTLLRFLKFARDVFDCQLQTKFVSNAFVYFYFMAFKHLNFVTSFSYSNFQCERMRSV